MVIRREEIKKLGSLIDLGVVNALSSQLNYLDA